MKYAEAVELTQIAQMLFNDEKNIFLRSPVANAPANTSHVIYQVGIRRVYLSPEDLHGLNLFCMRHGKSMSIQPAQRERHPEDVFIPLMGSWESESLIIIIQ